jgi:hypothetical protein
MNATGFPSSEGYGIDASAESEGKDTVLCRTFLKNSERHNLAQSALPEINQWSSKKKQDTNLKSIEILK